MGQAERLDGWEDPIAPGWDALDAILALVYDNAVPRHVSYSPPAAFSTNLQGCAAYDTGEHWHYVSYGLSELFTPAPDADPRFSGWGFELSMRVPHLGLDYPPDWPFTMINQMAKHVRATGQGLVEGDRVDLNEPVTGFPHVKDAPRTGLTVYAVTRDPRLGVIDTPNGSVTFRQLVGVTAAEAAEMRYTSTHTVLSRLAQWDPWMTTDPERA
ncbi:suppressor of fused domain protein [Cellulomonas bogoriensis]|uniref:Suppressor of fused-like domain-containing protein n=1 Tax=Cellulomonas bogoriensis 69B4 = DSM 16987 TaxID=1386082 RepID=A0A0A0BYX5_9CELL|nr:suppressor of fused domain protein [Cellulomonas bogoriensis]KGM12897.1 hypothetical protein N869_00970 [Cellulomonas bogoriensis 69B4 = DSM 16987]